MGTWIQFHLVLSAFDSWVGGSGPAVHERYLGTHVCTYNLTLHILFFFFRLFFPFSLYPVLSFLLPLSSFTVKAGWYSA